MNKIQTISKTAVAILAAVISSNSFSAPVNVTVTATADNDFIVVHTQGNSHPIKMNNPGYNNFKWKKPERKTFSIDNTKLKGCYIDIIAWNDHSSNMGLAAKLTGDNGTTVLSGSSLMKTYSTKKPNQATWNGSYPAQPLVNQILHPSSLISDQPHHIANVGGGVWGNIGSSLPSTAKWIWPKQSLNNKPYKKNFTVYRTACNRLVKPGKELPNVRGEHYQCYNLEKTQKLKPETIYIQDQFGKSEAVLGRPRILCNPSLKVHNRKTFKIQDKKRHLVCYDIIKQSRNNRVNVEISNQFEYQNVVASKREMFCVPSYKKHLNVREVPRNLRKNMKKAIRK